MSNPIGCSSIYVDDAVTSRINLGIDIFQSPDQTITSAGALTIAHGLGRVPTEVWCSLVCQTGEANYIAADIIPSNCLDGGANKGWTCTVDATNLNIRYGSAANVFSAKDKTTGATTALTNGNWRTVFYAR